MRKKRAKALRKLAAEREKGGGMEWVGGTLYHKGQRSFYKFLKKTWGRLSRGEVIEGVRK